MNSLPESPLKLKDQTTMKETMKANLTAPVPTRTLPPATAKSDRELLELAAKAAGIVLYVQRDEYEAVPPECHARLWDKEGTLTVLFWSDARDHPMCRKNQRRGNVEWNPLTDDGDALRLAVKLSVKHGITVEIKREEASGNADAEAPDAYAATRLAIVRAAAAIGEMNSFPLLPPKG